MSAGQDSEDLELAITQAAPKKRDIEAERIYANLRRRLCGVDHAPTSVGRFEVLGMIGAGAMGTVYRARDPELERDVAIKVLREDGRSHAQRIREARALARLSHPNAITVYEAGEDRGAVFIAMELVRGKNLRDWAAETDEGWPGRLDVMIAAGRGLAAAHEAGIVHGDFKPDNVLVGADQAKGIPLAHVRVADFGLAHLETITETDGTSAPGGLVGTPAYMSPEQLEGERATEESDQYSFAVSLFEVLCGSRPFSADSVESLREAIVAEPIPETAMKDLPPWLRRVVVRALSPDPRDRYPSMQALISELDRQPGRRRWRVAFAVAAIAAVVASGLAYHLAGSRSELCDSGKQSAAALWNPTRRARIGRAFVATGVDHAARSLEKVGDHADSFADRWATAYRQVCEATLVRGEQSDSLMDARMLCLSHRWGRANAVLTAIEGVDSGAELVRAVRALREGDDISSCLEPAGVPAEDRLPEDPKERARAQELLAQIDHGWALYSLGRYSDAHRVADLTAQLFDEVKWPLARARAMYLRGAVEGRTGTPGRAETDLRTALDYAAEAGADRLTADIWQRLLKDALFAGHHARVIEWADFARAAAVRGRGSSATIDAIVGEAHLLAGRPKQAVAVLEVAIEALKAERASDRFVALVLANLGNGLFQLKRYGEAEARYGEALVRAQSELGFEHPGLARYYDKLGIVALHRGNVEAAIAHHRRAVAMREQAYGAADRAVATSLLGLGNALRASGQLQEAAAVLDRALEIRKQAYGPDHLRLADALASRGRVAYDAGQHNKAATSWREALAIRQRESPEHSDIAKLECYLAVAQRDGDLDTTCP